MNGPVDGPADLTPLQRKYVRNLWEYCHRPPTLGRLYANNAAPYVVFIAFMVMSIYFCLVIERYEIAWMVGGMSLGILLRNHGAFRVAIQLWPVTAKILDRDKLAVLADEAHVVPDRDDWS